MREQLVRAGSDRARGSRSWSLPRFRVLVPGLAVVFGTLVLCTGRAQAATGHQFVSSMTEATLGTGLLEPAAVAVERSSGGVFVGDRLSGVVDVYSSTGEYEAQLGGGALEVAGIAVDEASGDVYVADPFHEAVWVYRPDGKGGYELLARWFGGNVPGKEFGKVTGVAVDNSGGPSQGDVYVVEAKVSGATGGAVDVFAPKPNPEEGEAGAEGQFLGRLSGVKLEQPNGIAVSQGTGRILVADSVKGAIFAYNPAGEYEEKLNGKGSPNGVFSPKGEEPGNVAAIAVDEAAGDIYVAEAERRVVSQYSSKGVWKGWITETPEGGLGEPRGLALTPAGDVYLADAGLAVVDRFGADMVVPDVKTGKVAKTTLTRTTAVLSGTINGDGIAAQYSFQYGETPALGSQTLSNSSGGTGEASVSAEVTGLEAGTTYYYRIVGENENGANVGIVRSFQTFPAVEELETGPIKELEPESVRLTGTLSPGGIDTRYYFQWGATSAYGNTTPAPPGTDAGSGTSTIEAATLLTGLSANTLYHYRLVGENEQYGATYGQDRTFTTSGPPSISYEPPSEITQTEATIHAQVTPDQLQTTYRFQYGQSTAYEEETPVGGEAIGSGQVPVARWANLTGLKVGTTYHYRVLAENQAGITDGPDQTFTTVPPAPVEATYATNVGATEATLHARINPLGNDTRYYFQYGTQSCQASPGACTNTPAPPGEDIGEGSEPVARDVQITGLQPDTTYHFRVLDSNTLGETEGLGHTFTTQQEASFALPDNRAWEMVTPPDKEGAPVEALTREGGIILAAEDGSALTYVVNGALGEEVEGNRSPEMQQVLATRGQSAWSSQDIATPNSIAKGITAGLAPEYQFFTPSLSLALVEPAEYGANPEPPLAPGVTQPTMYLRDNATGTYLPLISEANTAPGTKFSSRVHFVSATPDLSRVVITSEVALTGAGSSHGLYEWAGGQLHLVSLLPNEKPASTPELGYFGRGLAHAISNDGSRIVWTNTEDLGTLGGHLYMRDTVKGETLQLDAAQGVVEPGQGSAQFQTASSNGSRVFFTDRQRLTADSTAEPGQGAGQPDLYACQITEVAGKLRCDLKDLTVDHNEGEHAAVRAFIFGAGEDGTKVYLVAQGILADNENGNGATAKAGKNNLYELDQAGSQWGTTFIATLAEEDSAEWQGGTVVNTSYLTARVSSNGRYLAFMSQAAITGYDNVDANPQAEGARDEEVFLFDSDTGSLRCVSCNPSGARPNGVLDKNGSGEGLGLLVDRRRVWLGHWIAGNIPGWTAQTLASAVFQSRYLSNEGRLYFNSPDSLVPAAKNGKEDVYEYEPSGAGSCQSATGGCISLISGGSSDRESAFIEATPDGSNVFFLTQAQLLPHRDTDTAFDIYDARECSNLSPCLTPPAEEEAGCASAEACHSAAPAQQIPAAAPPTTTASGSGNVVSTPFSGKQEARGKATTKPPTRAERLKRALKSCRKHHQHAKKKRKACMRKARKRYGNHHKAKRSKHKAKKKANARTSRSGRSSR
jgi:phosphodiesterase/alkaline phosphatase D-like protein